MNSKEHKFCTFHIGKYLFGVEANDVQEVIRYQDMTTVPLADPIIKGLINLRGQIVTAVDLRKKMDFEELEPGKLPMNVVVRTDENSAVSFLVDQIGDVLDVSEDRFEAPPENIQGKARALIKRVCKLEDRLLLILNTEEVLATTDMGKS